MRLHRHATAYACTSRGSLKPSPPKGSLKPCAHKESSGRHAAPPNEQPCTTAPPNEQPCTTELKEPSPYMKFYPNPTGNRTSPGCRRRRTTSNRGRPCPGRPTPEPAHQPTFILCCMHNHINCSSENSRKGSGIRKMA